MNRGWLKAYRRKKGMSQAVLSRLIGIDITAVSKYELGARRPSPEVAKRIADVLDFDWTWFYENHHEAKPGDQHSAG